MVVFLHRSKTGNGTKYTVDERRTAISNDAPFPANIAKKQRDFQETDGTRQHNLPASLDFVINGMKSSQEIEKLTKKLGASPNSIFIGRRIGKLSRAASGWEQTWEGLLHSASKEPATAFEIAAILESKGATKALGAFCEALAQDYVFDDNSKVRLTLNSLKDGDSNRNAKESGSEILVREIAVVLLRKNRLDELSSMVEGLAGRNEHLYHIGKALARETFEHNLQGGQEILSCIRDQLPGAGGKALDRVVEAEKRLLEAHSWIMAGKIGKVVDMALEFCEHRDFSSAKRIALQLVKRDECHRYGMWDLSIAVERIEGQLLRQGAKTESDEVRRAWNGKYHNFHHDPPEEVRHYHRII